MTFEAPDYGASLRECVRGYKGAHERAVLRTPDVYGLFARLFAHPRLPGSARPIVNAVLAYFVASDDVLPEEKLGPYGLLDDLFVAAHAYRLLRREMIPDDLVAALWRAEGDPDEVMAEIYTESRAAVGKEGRVALKMAGIAK